MSVMPNFNSGKMTIIGIPENVICHNSSKVDGLEASYIFPKRYA